MAPAARPSPPAPPPPPRRVVILAPPNAQLLEIVGPAEVFAMAELKLREARRARASGYAVEVVSAGPAPTIQSNARLELNAARPYRDVTGPVDTLLIAGGMEVWLPETRELLDWLRAQAKTARRIGSLCTGTFLLAEAGLLDGRRVTTHWYFCRQLASRYPGVAVDPEPIYVRDGNLSTCAGGTSNFDLALAMVEEDLGTDIALRIARGLVLFLRRPAGQNQFSNALAFQASVRQPMQDLPVFIHENLGAPLGVDTLADRARMSVRNFSRLFKQEYGVTPARFVERLRVETVARLVRESDHSFETIAADCGLGGMDAMRRAFLAVYRQTPAEMRGQVLPS